MIETTEARTAALPIHDDARASVGSADGDLPAGARRVRAAFAAAAGAGRTAFVPYLVAGYPDEAGAGRVADALLDAGADLLEIGLPYSDPLADGATLQRASATALRAGASPETALRLVERLAASHPDVPLVVMGYANQLVGADDGRRATAWLAGAGASGVIVADLTPDEGEPFERHAAVAGLGVVYLVAPTTPPGRRARVAARCTAFLYCVSLVGTTGARSALSPAALDLVRSLTASASTPVAVGFGVSQPAHVRALARAGADGVIVASALVDALGPDGTDVGAMARVARGLRDATDGARRTGTSRP